MNVVDQNHSQVGFKVRHIVSKVSGRFGEFSGTFEISPENLTDSSVTLTIQTASINTDNERRDTHLRSEDFFSVDKFPEITFKSTKIREAGDDEFEVDGILTIHGVAMPTTVDVTFLGFAKMGDANKAGFDATAKINRKDFDMVWNRALDQGGTILGDTVTISINLELNKQ